jgi:hypothetical protein
MATICRARDCYGCFQRSFPRTVRPPTGVLCQSLELCAQLGERVIPSQHCTCSIAARGNHCAQWRAWFERIGAEQAGPLVQVSAPRSAPVSLVAVRTTVYRAYKPHAKTRVDCTLGAGALGGTYLEHNLDRPVAPSRLASQFGAHKFAMPPAVFRVGAGGSEDVAIQPAGRPGRFYDWGLTLDMVVDQRSQRFTFGSRAHPLRSYVPRAPQADNIRSVDYNFGTRSWDTAF